MESGLIQNGIRFDSKWNQVGKKRKNFLVADFLDFWWELWYNGTR